MAGDWIRMRSCLITDPKVMAIGRHLQTRPIFSRWLTCDQYDDAVICDGALRYVVTGALHNVWCNANEHCDGDTVLGADLLWVDAVSGIEGFGSAMESVGWVESFEGGIRFPKFNRHNTSGAERQRRYREKRALQSDVTRNVTQRNAVAPREEKRREEKNTGGIPPITPRSTRKPRQQKAAATTFPPAFLDFWQAFPPGRRTDRPGALQSWLSAVDVLTGTLGAQEKATAYLTKRAADYASSDQGRGQYVRMPATWLNQQGYDDPPEAWMDKNGKPPTRKETPDEKAARLGRLWEEQDRAAGRIP